MPGLCLAFVLSACQQEPDFDERFDAASEQIEKKAAEIDRELEKGNTLPAHDLGNGDTMPERDNRDDQSAQ